MKQNWKKCFTELSIRWKYLLTLAAMILLLIAGVWVVNHYFLQQYYQSNKLRDIRGLRLQVEDYLLNNHTEAGALLLRQNCDTLGVRAMIVENSGLVPVLDFSNADGEGGLTDRLFRVAERPQTRYEERKVYEEGESYRIYLVRDPATRMDQVECIGRVDVKHTAADELQKDDFVAERNYWFILSTPLASLAQAAAITNRFLLWVGIGTLLLGIVLVSVLSRRLTRPIEALTKLSQEMAALNLTARYEGNSGDELQLLGNNMNAMASNLAEKVSELETANQHLAEGIREKEKTDERRRALLGNISHELKTPIALIQGYAEGLRDGISDDPESRTMYCDIILDEAQKMNRLVQQLLSINELESGMVKPDKTLFNLSELLTSAAGVYRLQLAEKKAGLELYVPEKLPVVSDEFLLEQVVQNYLSNALHYVDEGGRVVVTAENKGGRTEFTVFNTGSNIPEESLPRIWDQFYKVDKARTRSYGGSGIGLSLVKAIMELLGGSCSAENLADGVLFRAVL